SHLHRPLVSAYARCAGLVGGRYVRRLSGGRLERAVATFSARYGGGYFRRCPQRLGDRRWLFPRRPGGHVAESGPRRADASALPVTAVEWLDRSRRAAPAGGRLVHPLPASGAVFRHHGAGAPTAPGARTPRADYAAAPHGLLRGAFRVPAGKDRRPPLRGWRSARRTAGLGRGRNGRYARHRGECAAPDALASAARRGSRGSLFWPEARRHARARHLASQSPHTPWNHSGCPHLERWERRAMDSAG